MESTVKEIKVKGSEQTIKFSMGVVGDHLSFSYAHPARTLVDGEFKSVPDVGFPFGTYDLEGWHLCRKFQNRGGVILSSVVNENFKAEMKAWQFEARGLQGLAEAGIAPEQIDLLNSIYAADY